MKSERGTRNVRNAERGTRNAEQLGEVGRHDARIDVARSDFRVPRSVIDSHVHFWDPAELHYPWLEGVPALSRAFLPADYAAATGEVPISKLVFVEANCRPAEARREVQLVERLAAADPRIAGIVAFADLAAGLGARDTGLEGRLDELSRSPLVKGIRQNIQGQPAGFCLQPAFVRGVQAVGRRGLTFDLCPTHDQVRDVVELVRQCPETRFVLDHCGKPAIRTGGLDPWREDVARLAAHDNVWCKLSGLLTEADPGNLRDETLTPYAACVVECFGSERVMYGSDWPVLSVAASYCDWYGFTDRFTARWGTAERSRFYADTAARFYGL
jgi:L-fuconolactonase